MNKDIIKVPKGIRYISEWENLENLLPQDKPYIMNKTITGCGYTEYCITNDKPVILCSPRLILLANKENQHQEMENLLYLRNEFDSFEEYDRDINKDDLRFEKEDKEKEERRIKAEAYSEHFKDKVRDHVRLCLAKKLPPKFLVTYDSFRRVREALGETGIQLYDIVVDEFQSIFCDSRFKSDTENTFLQNIKDLKKVCYLSATPMVDKYLDMLDEFKDLKYFELDWGSEDPSRIVQPYLKTKQCKSIISEALRIVESYKSGNFEKLARRREDGSIEEIYSTEAVIYINSVKNICDIIRKCGLKLEETNILCAETDDNEKKIREAFNKGKSKSEKISSKVKCIGTVPKEGETHKMFTLCTRTVYLGADFYSKCARSFILSDADIECLSVDITLDLPQILGRQRLITNPWKNRAELYFKTNSIAIDPIKFEKYLNKKTETTNTLLSAH